MSFQLNTIEEAIEDIKAGKVIIVVDDEDRENEGDFLAAAEMVSPSMINFMATHGRGLICTPVTEPISQQLKLDLMVGNNTDPHETAFTVSVDLIGGGNTTGISAADRSRTIEAMLNPNTTPDQLGRPGHVFPLKAKTGGVLRRPGHTEAAIDFARLAGFAPAGVIVEIMNEDGTMARLPELMEVSKKHNLKIVSIEALIAYRMQNESLIETQFRKEVEIEGENYTLIAYQQTTTKDSHFALVKGKINGSEDTVVRVHSSRIHGSLHDLSKVNKSGSLAQAFERMKNFPTGVILFMDQMEKQKQAVQRSKSFAPSKIAIDSLDYGVGAQILRDLGVEKMKILTNNPQPLQAIEGYGLEVTGYEALH